MGDVRARSALKTMFIEPAMSISPSIGSPMSAATFAARRPRRSGTSRGWCTAAGQPVPDVAVDAVVVLLEREILGVEPDCVPRLAALLHQDRLQVGLRHVDRSGEGDASW